MQDSKKILAVGSIAFDSIETPNGNRKKILGGSATYFGVSASQFSAVSLIGIVGDDFTKSDWVPKFKSFVVCNVYWKLLAGTSHSD